MTLPVAIARCLTITVALVALPLPGFAQRVQTPAVASRTPTARHSPTRTQAQAAVVPAGSSRTTTWVSTGHGRRMNLGSGGSATNSFQTEDQALPLEPYATRMLTQPRLGEAPPRDEPGLPGPGVPSSSPIAPEIDAQP